MFTRPKRRRPTINREKCMVFLVTQDPAPLQAFLHEDQWLLIESLTGAAAESGARELTSAGQLPDLLLIELGLPDQTGFALWSKLQRLRGWSGIPCILLGASVDEALVLQAFEAGASDYIHPPYDSDIFLRKLHALLDRGTIPLPTRTEEIEPGMIFDARYKILQKIGRGGMSEVFLVEDRRNDALRALKLFAPKGQEDKAVEQERFRREIRALIGIRHPHVVRVYDIGFVGSLYYYTMDYLSGGSLVHVLKQGAISPKEALRITAQMASALQAIHKKGLQHRDLKPGNIMFSEAGEPILTDFGLVLDLGASRLTHEEIVIGTPIYMSPERLTLEQEIDHRSDIYSLGLVFYEMLAGQLPYQGLDLLQIHRTMMAGLAPPTIYQPDIPNVAWEICRRATQYQPEERYKNAAVMELMLIDALQELSAAKILLLDDDPMISEVFVNQMISLGLECKIVTDGNEGAAIASQWQPDMCLINIGNPRLRGISMYQKLRKTPHLSQTPCLFVAEKWTEEGTQKAMRMGAKECLTKPFSVRSMATKLQQMIAHAQRTHPTEALQPRTLINERYELNRLLQQGRISLVYLATDRQTGTQCAFKTLQPGFARQKAAQLRIIREMETLKKCHHPNIPSLLGVGRFQGTPYFLTSYFSGDTLSACLQRSEVLDLEAALALTARLADALGHIHALAMLHGHITPDNILLTRDGQPMLLDFGETQTRADATDPDLHALPRDPQQVSLPILTTLQYMAPEQCVSNEKIGVRSDLYVLGLVFFEMLTGIAPFAACSTGQALRKVANQGIPSPLRFQPFLPPAIELFCKKLLAPRQRDRYASAAHLQKDCMVLLRRIQRTH